MAEAREKSGSAGTDLQSVELSVAEKLRE